VHCGPHCSF